jgi:hypothetical protein
MLIYTKDELNGSLLDPRGHIWSYYIVNNKAGRKFDLPIGVYLLTCKLCGYTTEDQQWHSKEFQDGIIEFRSDALRHLLTCHLDVHWQPSCECGQRHPWKCGDHPDGIELHPNGLSINIP